jgi:4-hydroxy-tetrahydrodipicolinate reductase|tara:strand:+ start:612 stop:1319 length:708 start_codon:yes stop_codon:yes gene_type:complete
MKIALFGYGKMGKVIDKIAKNRGHEIIYRIEENSINYDLKKVDVAIDFSTPKAAFSNINMALENSIPIISGTTGWLDHYNKAVKLCNEKNGAFLYASNFSLGVNIFFEINRQLAKIMNNYPEYVIKMKEIHHIEKIDAPSGTAITLAESIIKETDYQKWSLNKDFKENEISIEAQRLSDKTGTHEVIYKSEIDEIKIKHAAENREGFGLGAVIAAEWLIGKKGVFSMKDVLNINS